VAAHARYQLAGMQRRLHTIQYAATHDPLTGLLNRSGLAKVWPRVAGARPHIALIDLDGFKPINDRHGHDVGDQLLAEVAERLMRHVPGYAVRLGGDEFAAILAAGHPGRVAATIATAIAQPVTLPTCTRVAVTASIGLAACPDRDLAAALARADAAMYRAKAAGHAGHAGPVAFYDPRLDDHTSTTADPRPAVRVRDLSTADQHPGEVLAPC
jgi:diguanylate cyclase (GGDEF)-like protein